MQPSRLPVLCASGIRSTWSPDISGTHSGHCSKYYLGCSVVKRIFLLSLCLFSNAEASVFGPYMESDSWQSEASIFECAMVYPMPGFGKAVFATRAGEDLHFSLVSALRELSPADGQLSSEPTVWSERRFRREMGDLAFAPGSRPITLAKQQSRRMIKELVDGNQLSFSVGGKLPLNIAIAPVGFRETLEAYQACLASLLPVNFSQVERTALYFKSSGVEPFPVNQQQKLERVATYVKADPRVRKIYVDGHTDSRGTREDNLLLAEQRAQEVVDLLVGYGVPESVLVKRWHGERYPVASNGTAEGRSQNRRVTIRLERADN